jgi:hypothetical protein
MEECWKVDVGRQRQVHEVETTVVVHELQFKFVVVVVI